jgi:hypothetical protein
MSICPWDSILGKVQMVAGCILETESSSAKSLTMPLANVGGDLPEKVCGVKPLAELTRAIQGEK